jgi:tRNA pseudouridine55 synthase
MPRRSKRDINGVLLLNKPIGITSNDAMIRIRGIFHAQKAGHTGALDPLATGMLPICLGEATKFSQYLLDADKCYDVTARFGIRTTTSDAEGEVIKEAAVNFNEEQLLLAMAGFMGKQKQVPSMFSALKYEGKPLYEYARKGITVPREARDINIFEFKLDSFDGRDAVMHVHCSKGTYIRSLIDDLGEKLGCGAHVIKLDRTMVAEYPRERMVSFEDLDRIMDEAHADGLVAFDALDALLLPVDTAVQKLPIIYLNNEQGRCVLMGQRIKVTPVNMLTTDLQPIRIYIGEDKESAVFAGVGDIKYDLLAPKRLVSMSKLPVNPLESNGLLSEGIIETQN